MQTENKFFEDFSKMLNGLAGTVAGMGREAQDGGREKLKAWLGGMDFVSREEFEAVKAMAAAARDEVAALRTELAALKPAAYAGPTTGGGGIGAPAQAPHAPTSFDEITPGNGAPAGL